MHLEWSFYEVKKSFMGLFIINTCEIIWIFHESCKYNFTILFFVSEGCGSGLSGETLSENGHQWIGLDISQSMLSMSDSWACLKLISLC